MNQYEAMFLFDSTFANDYANVEKELQRILERAEAELVVAGKWDERKLAYEINRRKRGLYVLVYFRAHPDRIGGIERDCQLAEHVLRVLIVQADGVTRQKMEQLIASPPAAAQTDRPYGRPWDRDRPRAGKPPGSAPAAKAPVAKADVAKTDVAKTDVAKADVAKTDVAKADVAKADVEPDEEKEDSPDTTGKTAEAVAEPEAEAKTEAVAAGDEEGPSS